MAGRVGRRDHRAVAEPEGHPRPGHARRQARRHPRRRRRWPWSPTGRSCASASTARKVGAAKAVASARELARLVGIDAAAYAKRVEASGPLAFVEAIVYRQDEVPRGVLSGVRRIKGGAAIAAELPLAPTKGFAAPILGSVGEVTAEMIEENPDFYELGDVAGLSGLQARYDEQLRGTPGQAVNAVGSDGKTRELFRVRRRRRAAAAADHGRADAGRRRAGAGRASAGVRAGRHQAVDRRDPGRGQRPGYRRPQHRDVRAVRARVDVQVGLVAGPAARRASPPSTVVPCTTSIVVDGKRFENYDDYPASGLGNIPLRTAVANSCNTAFISQRGKLGQHVARRRGRLARHGRRPRPRLPGVLRQRRAARRRDREGGGPDRPGQDPRLADGDGDGDRLDPGRAGSWCRRW